MSDMISAQVSDDLADQIDATRDGDPPDYDEPRSAAVRRLVRAGLDDTDEQTQTFTTRPLSTLFTTIIIGYPTVATYYGRPDTAVGFIAVIACYVLFEPQVSRAISQLPNPLNRL